MTFRPASPRALAAFTALADRPEPATFADEVAALTRVYPFEVSDLRELLVAAVCPPFCVGVVNDTGWHHICEEKADRAIAALDFYGDSTGSGA